MAQFSAHGNSGNASAAGPSSDSRCGSCGKPTDGTDICDVCREAFSAVLRAGEAAPQVNGPEPADVDTDPKAGSLWAELMNTPAPPPMDTYEALPQGPATPEQAKPAAPVVAAMPAAAVDVAVSAPQPIVQEPEMAMPSVRNEPVTAPLPAATPATPSPDVKSQETRPATPSAGPTSSGAGAPKSVKTPSVDKGTNTPPASVRNYLGLALAATLLFVAAAAGVGGWLALHNTSATAVVEQQAQANESSESGDQIDDRRPPTKSATAAERSSSESRPAAAAPQKPVASARSKPLVPVKSKKAAPAVAPARSAAVREVATEPVAAPVAALEVVVAPPPPPAAPASGPFYQPTEVNEVPRVATRVDPRLPDDLRARRVNEIVIVRALVSQGGHPSRVSLLRRSRTGPSLDDAVIDAVTRWTFSPATRRGEVVSCWLNFAVVVGQPD
jgi:TonB family protein